MIFSQVKVNPGRGIVQLPHPWGDKVPAQGMAHSTIFEPIMHPHPDTFFIGMHFAKAIPATAAGTVPGMFGAPRLRAEEGKMLDGAIPAASTGQQGFFKGIFKYQFQQPPLSPEAKSRLLRDLSMVVTITESKSNTGFP